MRIALVHDYLNQYGGGERVLETFMKIFPEAPIFTLFFDNNKTYNRFADKTVCTSFLDKKIVADNHRIFIPLMPIAAFSINLADEYDVILSSSAGFGKGIRHGKNAFHITYCHTPLRYAWENKSYFNWHPFLDLAATPAFWYLRNWDYHASQKPDFLFANSKYIAGKVKQYYKRDAEILYPPVDLKTFNKDKKINKDNYFLAVGRMLNYKKFDLIIHAFNKLNLNLLIVGNGPELENLKKISKSSKIHFLPFVSDDQLRILYNSAEALIFPQVEDFGLVAAEAQACGTPVIAFSQGGAKEIIEDGITGIFFNHQTIDDLIMAVKKFQLTSFDRNIIHKLATRFSKTKFENRILKIVNNRQ